MINRNGFSFKTVESKAFKPPRSSLIPFPLKTNELHADHPVVFLKTISIKSKIRKKFNVSFSSFKAV